MLQFGRLGEGFKTYYALTIRFNDASGLLKGSDVLLAGAKIGKVAGGPRMIPRSGRGGPAMEHRPHRAVLFDLFDTLCRIDERTYLEGKAEEARLLDLDPETFLRVWVGFGDEAQAGVLPDIAARVRATTSTGRPNGKSSAHSACSEAAIRSTRWASAGPRSAVPHSFARQDRSVRR